MAVVVKEYFLTVGQERLFVAEKSKQPENKNQLFIHYIWTLQLTV